MSNLAIKVENVSKLYRLGTIGTGTIRHDLHRWWTRVRGKDDPYAKIGQQNDRTKKAASDYVWALKDIDFEVEQGEVLGVIGRNGAGKSTLLKILSKITSPTQGMVKVNGRIASLLEVGTGFHPELTGRENIFLNGAILGMREWEVQKKFDEIVDFSGVEAYIDTPVKRYSSGMYVRLAFAVAAYLEPDILIVDEVLAVGDAEFQKKCMGRMKDVSTNQGRTVLFVSHNMPSIKSLCKNAVVLEMGTLRSKGTADDIVRNYLAESIDDQASGEVYISQRHRRISYSREMEFVRVALRETLFDNNFASRKQLSIEIELKVNVEVPKWRIGGSIFSENHVRVGTFYTNNVEHVRGQKTVKVQVDVTDHNLAKGRYYFAFSVGNGSEESGNIEYDIVYELLPFNITHKTDLGSPIVKWPSDWGYVSFQATSKVIV